MSLEQAVSTAIDALDTVHDRDLGTRELALVFARQLDKAAAIRAAADKALREAEASGDETLIEQVAALRTKVSEQGTVDRIGARLLSALDALLMTPKAHAAATKGAPAHDEPDPLDELLQHRRRRAGGA